MEIGKCSVSTCKADGVKAIPIPMNQDTRNEFEVIYVCEYHIARFDELYEEKELHDDTESMR
ncbi:hypothetical protein [Nitrososphaera sp. AFS]|uniref:hypothetical protein n=1 Tax=Nitrososphaera sp. AFS TaxID=2301191 RepID=UPI0013921FE3|nr:hypothetical protein [Nitrososphaera sp. AFS]NAL77746.1 hypothetical protein [Nitrososphaera sp. AFS]